MLMTFSILFVVLVLAIQLFVTLSGKDLWPFSAYNMFSAHLDINQHSVFRVALERNDGEIVWWKSHFYRYPEQVGKQIRPLYQLEDKSPKTKMVVALETRKTLMEVARLIRREEGEGGNYQAFHLIERKARVDRNNEITIEDKTVARIPFCELLNQSGESND
jgi:hypothetical protein